MIISISECDHQCETSNAESEIGCDRSNQTLRNWQVVGFRSGSGPPRVGRWGFWTGLETNRLILLSNPWPLASNLDPLLTLNKTLRAVHDDLVRSVWDFESSGWDLSTAQQVAIYGVQYLWGSGFESFITTIHIIYHIYLCDNHQTKSYITILYV